MQGWESADMLVDWEPSTSRSRYLHTFQHQLSYVWASLIISFIDILHELSMGCSPIAVRHQIGSKLIPPKENPPTHFLSQRFEIKNVSSPTGHWWFALVIDANNSWLYKVLNINTLHVKTLLSEPGLAAYNFRCSGAPANFSTHETFASHHSQACHR